MFCCVLSWILILMKEFLELLVSKSPYTGVRNEHRILTAVAGKKITAVLLGNVIISPMPKWLPFSRRLCEILRTVRDD